MNKWTSFEEQKGTRYIRENVCFGIIVFSCLSPTKPCLRFLLNCFVTEIKDFHWSSSGNEVDYRNIMNVSQNILAKNFCIWKSTVTTTLISSCHWKILVPFCLRKTRKRIFNTNSELLQNRTEKQIMPFKATVNWLFNDLWCYLVTSCFDWKNGLIQQTVGRGLLYP